MHHGLKIMRLQVGFHLQVLNQALSDEQSQQKSKDGTHGWKYNWNEDNQSWDLVDGLA